jgi:hypothetical protein
VSWCSAVVTAVTDSECSAGDSQCPCVLHLLLRSLIFNVVQLTSVSLCSAVITVVTDSARRISLLSAKSKNSVCPIKEHLDCCLVENRKVL